MQYVRSPLLDQLELTVTQRIHSAFVSSFQARHIRHKGQRARSHLSRLSPAAGHLATLICPGGPAGPAEDEELEPLRPGPDLQ
eukprot:3597806-Pyramimonas_sp.AAC.2